MAEGVGGGATALSWSSATFWSPRSAGLGDSGKVGITKQVAPQCRFRFLPHGVLARDVSRVRHHRFVGDRSCGRSESFRIAVSNASGPGGLLRSITTGLSGGGNAGFTPRQIHWNSALFVRISSARLAIAAARWRSNAVLSVTELFSFLHHFNPIFFSPL